MSKSRLLIWLALGAALLVSCTANRIAGTTDETVISARVYNPDLTPAVGALVRFFKSNDSTRTVAYQTYTDGNGRYSLKGLTLGTFNMLARSTKVLAKRTAKELASVDTLVAYQDSVIVLSDTVFLKPDTLQEAGSVTGIVGVQPNHDPRTVTVQVLGTDLYSNVDINGKFTLAPVARGNFNLRIVTTLADYTPTYLTISTAGLKNDTLADTLWLLYTGIPVIKSITASYDTLRGIVHLSWDTTNYFLLRDYVVYRDVAPVLTPSIQPIGNSTVCRYDDTITSAVSGLQTTFIYRVAVRAKNLEIGQTYTDAQVTAVPPFAVNPMRDTIPAYLGQPYTISAKVSGYTGTHVTYGWDIGNKGVFVPSLSPETTIVLHDTITQDYESVVKVLVDNTIFAMDTIGFATRFGWQKVAQAFADSVSTSKLSTVVLGNKMYSFVTTGNTSRVSTWQSSDGQNWTRELDSVPVAFGGYSNSKPVAFLNRICIVDNSGYLWTSPDAISWIKASTLPVCRTLVIAGSAWGPTPGALCPPALFVDGATILAQPFPGTGSDKILSSNDLITWDSTSGYQMNELVYDYTEQNGTLAVTGCIPTLSAWVCLKNSISQFYFSTPNDTASYTVSPNCLNSYKGVILFSGWPNFGKNPKIWAITNVPKQQWFICSDLPLSNVACYSLAVFNNSLYLVSCAGIYKATN